MVRNRCCVVSTGVRPASHTNEDQGLLADKASLPQTIAIIVLQVHHSRSRSAKRTAVSLPRIYILLTLFQALVSYDTNSTIYALVAGQVGERSMSIASAC